MLPAIGHPPSIELLPPQLLQVDTSYQRSCDTAASQKLIAAIARQWDWRLCVPLLVSRRQEGMFVIDGQHRLEGARRRPDILYLPCCVGQYDGVAAEAAVFVDANRRRRPVGKVDLHRAALAEGDADAARLQQLLEDADLRLVPTTNGGQLKAGELNCVSALQAALRVYGAEAVELALQAIATAFGDVAIAQGAPLVRGLCLAAASHELELERLVAALRTLDPAEWNDAARADPTAGRGGKSLAVALRRVVLDAYQQQLRRAA